MKIFTVSEMRAVEQEAFKRGIIPLRLMENAGSAFAKKVCDLFPLQGKKITVVVGNGNNGGDGYVAARKFKSYGAAVSIIRAFTGRTTDQCGEMAKKCAEIGLYPVDFGTNSDFCKDLLSESDIIVDAIFGIGFHGEADRYTAEIIGLINESPAIRVALDIPSGINANSGEVSGAAVKADLTVALAAAKYCHILPDASEYCGRVVCCSIGIPEDAFEIFGSVAETVEASDVAMNLKKRPKNSHKGTFGTAMFLCGSYSMAGAAILACKSAVRSGAGLTKLATVNSIYPIVGAALPETVHIPLKETENGTVSAADIDKVLKQAARSTALCIGCGMGKDRYAPYLLDEIFKNTESPILLDADGINAAAESINIFEHKKGALVLTPHPAEMARLYNTTAKDVNSDRIGFATRAAKDFGATVVLKGANTVIATSKGRVFVNMNGNAGMATAGSGDMLAGIITALMAQGISPDSSAVMGVYIHAAAGDKARDIQGEYSMNVEDMIEALPKVFKSLV